MLRIGPPSENRGLRNTLWLKPLSLIPRECSQGIIATSERGAGYFIELFTANICDRNPRSRHLAGAFGFQCLFGVHLDQLGFGFRLLRQAYLQHALFIMGAYLLWIHGVGKRERTGEAPVHPLDAMKVLLLLVLLEPALAADGERIVLNSDIDVFFVNARHFNLQRNVVFVFVDVHRRCEIAGGQRLVRTFGAERLTGNTVHAVLQCRKITTCHKCHTTTPSSEISEMVYEPMSIKPTDSLNVLVKQKPL